MAHSSSPFSMPENETGQTYLVTGGAGFIGSHTVRALLERGASVVVIDDFNDYYDPAIKEANVAQFTDGPAASRFTLYRADLRDTQAMAEIFQTHGKALQTGGIIHLAARAGVRPSLTQTRLYLETNVMGTMNLAEEAKKHDIKRFVFASSSSVYGDAPDQVPFHEDQDISQPISPYGSTKAQGESLLHTYSHLYGMNIVCLRFFTVYGPGQRPDLAIHKFTRLIEAGEPLPFYGDGSTSRDYTYVDDTLQGILAACHYTAKPFDIFNLGESQTVTLSQLVSLIEESVGKKAILDKQPMQPGDVTATYANIDKARAGLGYNPTTTIEEGIPKFVEWYKTHRLPQLVRS